jgi:adenylosuccinate lyase
VRDERLTALSPLDGRYRSQVEPLADFFSEAALIRHRVRVEVEWLLAMAEEPDIEHVEPLRPEEVERLRGFVEAFDESAAGRVKELEAELAHDVKAVETYLRERLPGLGLGALVESAHFCCTSEDVSNLAYALMLKGAVEGVWLPAAEELVEEVRRLAVEHRGLPLLARTHGQPATPTTLGKELAVFVHRWERQLAGVRRVEYLGKFNGATGTFSAHVVAYPNADWEAISRRFVERLGLVWNPLSTQIESHDFVVELLHAVHRFGSVVRDLAQDVWLYAALGYLHQRRRGREVGSSTMPHKVNPIAFENAEANVAVGNALIEALARELPVSRLQRDLSDSSKLRSLGVALGHSLLAIRSTLRGLATVEADPARTAADLDRSWEVLSEAVQIVMRRRLLPGAYDALHAFAGAGEVTRERLHQLVRSLDLPEADRDRLLELTPATYTGLAATLVRHVERPHEP